MTHMPAWILGQLPTVDCCWTPLFVGIYRGIRPLQACWVVRNGNLDHPQYEWGHVHAREVVPWHLSHGSGHEEGSIGMT